ncbi:D-alanyl-D-alanine carboxypeptidase family protein [Marinisporobacter balticus]|uniref:serine-type D-Ala-D-Ala carboxypeptidase n=1 Tax=Marinisporobacter balticus TaxID=2018667 RepID=A0A4R2LAM8_9FIRM|nr:D-alanyl-D-alanine carboxypeptidase family protein [Marinisporobacter balticus]TCO79828.1 D-alanyl-D-alanine carboxypeptidase (penicillin-binding protein 5/6) [Marinisporobacter balticus]
MRLKRFKIIVYFICVMLISSNCCLFVYGQEFEVNARSAILMDAGSGKIIYEKNIHDKLPPASVTKVMTMLLAMEAIDKGSISLEDQVLISERAASMGGSQLYLEPGEEKSVNDLLKGIAVASANDGCVALGEHISGTEEMFVKRMNERAKELGMSDTQFMNTNGLPQEGHYSSAYDIALMSKELLKYPKIHDYLTIWMSSMKVGLANKKQTSLQLTNTNKLIRTYPGANGIKTGYTSDAKYCLSASAKKNGFNLITVILGSPTSKIRFSEATGLLNYGFAAYSTVPIAKKNQMIEPLVVEKGKEAKVNAVAKDDLSALVKKGEESKVQKEIILPKSIKAPFKANEKVGEIILKKDGQEIGRVDIVTQSEVTSASALNMFQKMIIKTIQ